MTITIADDWCCHALEPRHDRHGHRCEASGVRFCDGGQSVCARHFDELAKAAGRVEQNERGRERP